MNIIIVGCGKVGYALVEQLGNEEHNIVVIDKNAKKSDPSRTFLTPWASSETASVTRRFWKPAFPQQIL